MPERFPSSEMRINPGVIWRKITSMAKYLPVAVGAAAVGRLAMSPNVAGMPEVAGFLTFFEGMAFIGLGERYLLLKAQERKEISD